MELNWIKPSKDELPPARPEGGPWSVMVLVAFLDERDKKERIEVGAVALKELIDRRYLVGECSCSCYGFSKENVIGWAHMPAFPNYAGKQA